MAEASKAEIDSTVALNDEMKAITREKAPAQGETSGTVSYAPPVAFASPTNASLSLADHLINEDNAANHTLPADEADKYASPFAGACRTIDNGIPASGNNVRNKITVEPRSFYGARKQCSASANCVGFSQGISTSGAKDYFEFFCKVKDSLCTKDGTTKSSALTKGDGQANFLCYVKLFASESAVGAHNVLILSVLTCQILIMTKFLLPNSDHAETA